jgi:hypothetical protein
VRAEEEVALLTVALAQAQEPPPGPVEPREDPVVVRNATAGDATPSWVTVGVGGVLLAAGVVVTTLGLLERSSVESPAEGATWQSIREAYDRGPMLEVAGAATLAVAATTLVVGVVLVLVAGESGASPDRADLGTWRF